MFSLIILLLGSCYPSLPSYELLLQVKSVGKFKETKRTAGISTSDIIMRIVKDYNQYVMRNLDRGYSRKDLGVSYVRVRSCYILCSSDYFSVLPQEVIHCMSFFFLTLRKSGWEWIWDWKNYVRGWRSSKRKLGRRYMYHYAQSLLVLFPYASLTLDEFLIVEILVVLF